MRNRELIATMGAPAALPLSLDFLRVDAVRRGVVAARVG